MRKVLNWCWSFVEVLIIIYVVLVTMFVLCKNKYGYTQFGDYSFANIDLIAEKNVKDTKTDEKVYLIECFYKVMDSSSLKGFDYIESIDKLTNIEIVDSAGCTYDEYVSYMILEINKDISIKRISERVF